MAHPVGHTDLRTAITVLGGPALFIFGNLVFKKVVFGKFAQSHITGIILLAVMLLSYHSISSLLLSVTATMIVVMVAAWETISVTRRKERASAHTA